MKVWELMAELAKAEAGADVFARRGEDTHSFHLSRTSYDAGNGYIDLIGDGSTPDDGDDIEL